MRKKIQASQEGRVINPITIIKIPITPAAPYLNNVTIIYLDKTPNLLELENPRGVRFSRPEISKWLGGIVREAVNWLIRPRVNKEL